MASFDAFKFRQELVGFDLLFDKMVPDHNIDIILSDFNDRLLKVINAHVPKKIKRVRRLNQPGWLSKDIKDCMQKRDWLKATGKFNDYKIMHNSIV